MILFASLVLGGCIAVPPASDQILARDLAPAFPENRNLSDAPVALAPAPGVRRYFGTAELGRLAARLHFEAAPKSELCFERRLLPLDPERMLEAMRKALPDAAIEILDFSRWGAPEGDPEFSRAGLRRSSAGSFWNGHVRYAGTKRYLVWAKVKLTVSAPSVVAVEDLPSSRVLDSSVLRVQTLNDFPTALPLPASIEAISGRVLRRPVRAGTVIRTEWLEPARDVRRGDSVRVEVRSGGARLEMEGRAAGSGSSGQTVLVVNPESRKTFPARIAAPGKVTVEKESR